MAASSASKEVWKPWDNCISYPSRAIIDSRSVAAEDKSVHPVFRHFSTILGVCHPLTCPMESTGVPVPTRFPPGALTCEPLSHLPSSLDSTEIQGMAAPRFLIPYMQLNSKQAKASLHM